jgi:serine/threonine protein phosphatase PrpC
MANGVSGTKTPELARWSIVGASVVGSGHISQDRGCDDANAYAVLGEDTVVLAVADGAGSARQGALGAQTAVRSVLSRVEGTFRTNGPFQLEILEEFLCNIFDNARSDIQQLALETNSEFNLEDYATTLLVALATPGWTAVAQVGDGLIVAEFDSSVRALTRPDHGEYLNETHFLTSSHYEDYLHVVVEPIGFSSLVLLSDGLEPIATDLATGEPFPPFFHPLVAFARSRPANEDQLVALLSSPRVCQRTDDDKTIVIAVWSEQEDLS